MLKKRMDKNLTWNRVIFAFDLSSIRKELTFAGQVREKRVHKHSTFFTATTTMVFDPETSNVRYSDHKPVEVEYTHSGNAQRDHLMASKLSSELETQPTKDPKVESREIPLGYRKLRRSV